MSVSEIVKISIMNKGTSMTFFQKISHRCLKISRIKLLQNLCWETIQEIFSLHMDQKFNCNCQISGYNSKNQKVIRISK